MIPIVDNASLSTDLDCQFNDLLKILHFYPTPPGLVQLTDPRLSDPRPMLDGSVINESVAGHAAIVQSKLNLNGVIPPNWFAPAPDIDIPAPLIFPVRGDLAELLPRKGAPNGYAAIDSNRRLLPANVTPGPGLGTVSEVIFSFPNQFTEIAPGAGAAISYNLTWKPVPNNCWFGINGDTGLPSGGPGLAPTDPQFHVEQLPVDLIPPIDAAKFTTGLCDPGVLPIAEFGEDHHPGMVPDPGLQGDPNDYLGRDIDWHHFLSGPPYQPQVTTPSIELISIQGNIATVTIRSREPGSVLFYRAGRPSFREAPPSGPDIHITLQVPRGILIEAYAAKQGYNNSNVASYTVSDDPGLPGIIDSIGNNIGAAGDV